LNPVKLSVLGKCAMLLLPPGPYLYVTLTSNAR
jgi:hypothetical protein